ncbi:MAG TPA: PAS domain S-box protein, partial [Spirochaetota bacterium]|nr:PAS domain S-box protein [Spirochaetota bacterium]
ATPQLLIMDSRFIDCNSKALELLGLTSKKKLTGLAPADISPERQSDGLLSRDKADFVINKAINDGFIEFEWLHRKKNGDDLHVMVSLSPHDIEGKRIMHAVWTDITERKKAEEALLESEKRFKTIFLCSNDAILLIDEERTIDCNPKAHEMFGYKRKELLNTKISELSPLLQPDGLPSKEKGVEHILKAYNSGYDRFEWLHMRASGEVFPAEVMLSSFYLDGKKLLLAAIRDITQNKQAEFELKQSEERYRYLADMAFEGILIHDNGTALDVNLTFCKMFGYERNELIGKNIIDMIIHRDYHALAYRKANARYNNPYEALSLKKDGSLLWIEIFGKPYIYNGKIVRVVATRDISDRKMIENILRESEEKFRRITESSLNELIITDEKGVIRFVSPSITRYTGFSPEKMIGKQIEAFFPENMAAKVRRHMSDALNGKAVGLFESNIFRADGSLASIEASIVMTASTNGRRELEIYMRDISEQKQLQQEIIRLSEAERKKMGQNLHDGLGQVLTGISIMIGTAARKIRLNRSVTYDEMIRIAQKVEEAIDTTRLTARGLYPVTLEKSGLISALREMAITVENSYGTKCRVYNQGNDTAPDVHTSYQLYYIVQEAINNAIRHGRAKKIDIDIVIKKKLIRFVVVNDITVKNRKKKSDGMGLRIMAYRAEMIGGTFSVKSTKKTFRVEVEIKYQ